MEMKCIFNIGKNISILAKVIQVSDVAHGPLVYQDTEYTLIRLFPPDNCSRRLKKFQSIKQ
jgi:hypothetical protein